MAPLLASGQTSSSDPPKGGISQRGRSLKGPQNKSNECELCPNYPEFPGWPELARSTQVRASVHQSPRVCRPGGVLGQGQS